MTVPLFSSPSCLQVVDLVTPDKMSIVLVSLFIAVFSLILIKKESFSTKSRLSLIYMHLFTLFFPLIFLSAQTACGTFCLSCNNNISALMLYALPTALVTSAIGGLVLVPSYYLMSNRRNKIADKGMNDFLSKYAKSLGIKQPILYAVDKAKPLAFSFRSIRSAIFISTGMLEITSKKERESILLHELAHLKQHSSAMKFSSHILRIFSPLSLLVRFNHDNNKEELAADRYAAEIQGTTKHLKSVKKKMREFT